MWPLKRQVQAATNHAFRGTARLAGLPIPQITEASASFADLHGRIDETIAFITGVDRATVEAGETREITFPMGGEQATMTGLRYFQNFTLPGHLPPHHRLQPPPHTAATWPAPAPSGAPPA